MLRWKFLLLQTVANVILLLTANFLGLTSFYIEDRQQRNAFLETRQCLEMKLVIEEQSAEQVSYAGCPKSARTLL